VRPFPLIGLLLVAAPAFAAPIAGGPIVKDGVEITILSIGPAGGPGGVVEVTLDAEARSDAAADRLRFRSLRGVTAVDCRLGANRFIKADAYPEANLRGQVTPRVVSGDWVKPADSSFMSGVTARVCGAAPAPAAAAGPLPVVTLGTRSNLPTASSAASPPAPPAPARIAMATSPRPAVQAATAAAPAYRAKAGGRGVAQVAASSTAPAAQHVLDRLHALITPPLTSDVEAATVNNAAVFRASVTGFVSLGDAQAFCARAASISKTCWVHWKAAEAAPPPARHP
jgi:SPOR domain